MAYSPSNGVRTVYVVAFVTPPAFAASTTIVATATIVAVAVRFAHHRGGTILKRIDADRVVAEHIFIGDVLALDFVERAGGAST